ncbi:GNAT family N-acetyltransferase [Xenorhabdus bovienii]|uniref:GNAT family N-acetyltransferase n=1 Tax=Xenorhabdus bovienii TaxID=40576 RepID=UPI00237CF4F7|nr:GNAT family N-acetyltransferase [Xenorhabdus bovienii]MDE1481697.1 GNAT family N-acetyltransferase [Xenorhabdus bovienii]MDE9431627.1 GNAT family N-acetyltransferase [Xenorhabdus bovienii]MDE9434741.1 GNAT family N-acetyltransferase [Xenorhabdus bovienii]MDE9440524.1 GNAT family N-acetyltransferase [Xenorhabdus bovienii]MDE9488934.1 GNAT family N-acetyltransferase [Xenorhabdus bovienii]
MLKKTINFFIPTEEDINGILALLHEVYTPFTADFIPSALYETSASIRKKLTHWKIAKYDSQVVAAVLVEQEKDNSTFCYLSVLLAFRRRGIASKLLNIICEEKRQQAKLPVIIALRRSLTMNIHFFTTQGFEYLGHFNTSEHDLYILR